MKLINLITICALSFSSFSVVANKNDNKIPQDAIPFDKTPPSVVKHFERDIQERIKKVSYAKKQLELLKKITESIEKYPFITLYIGAQGEHLIGFQVVHENEKLATNGQKNILKEYRNLVKEFHETYVIGASSFDFEIALKAVHAMSKKSKEQAKYNIVSRYPEYKDYHIDAVALFFLLVERSWLKEVENFIMNEMKENKKTIE